MLMVADPRKLPGGRRFRTPTEALNHGRKSGTIEKMTKTRMIEGIKENLRGRAARLRK